MDSIDDILNDLDSGKQAFADATPSGGNNNSNNGYKKQWQNNKPKQPREDLWNKTDFIPMDPEKISFSKNTKSFMFYNFSPNTGVPENIKLQILNVITALAKRGYTFRYNGHQDDTFLANIAKVDGLTVETYLPWAGFNKAASEGAVVKYTTMQAYQIASACHKKFSTLPAPVRAVLGNIVNTVYGKECSSPVDFVLAYTEGGAEAMGKGFDYKAEGNLSQILKLTAAANIPLFNFKNSTALANLKTLLT